MVHGYFPTLGRASPRQTGVWRELALAEPPQAPDLRELSVG
jgi:hypothetical protein